MKEEDASETIPLREAAQRLGVHPNTLRSWADRGRIPELRVGARGDRRYRHSDVREMKEALEATDATRDPSSRNAAVIGGAGFRELLRASDSAKMMAAVYGPAFEIARQQQALIQSFGLAASPLLSDVVRAQMLTATAAAAFGGAIDRAQVLDSVAVRALLANRQALAETYAQLSRVVHSGMIEHVFAALAPARRAIEEASIIAGRLDGIGLAVQQASTAIQAYQEFASAITAALPPPSRYSEGEANLAIGQLEVGGRILDQGMDTIGHLADAAPTEALSDPNVVAPTVYVAFGLQVLERRDDLIVLPRHELTIELDQMPAVRVAQAVRRFIASRHACNRTNQLLGREPVFKATTETEKIIGELSWSVARTEDDFRRFVDSLYRLLYESSGAYKRIPESFLKAHPDLFDLKHLRTLYEHDIEHGSTTDIQKKFQRAGDILQRLTGGALPTTAAAFQRAQRNLLDALADLLDELATTVDIGQP